MLEVGRVTRPHGLRGEVVVELVTNRLERVAAGAVLRSPEGDLTVERAVPHGDRWLVRFVGVADREAAERLRGAKLSAAAIDDPSVLWVHELVGAEVVDRDGAVLGTVSAVEANPASDLLVLEGGGLVPLTFVVETGPRRVVVDVPAGLLE